MKKVKLTQRKVALVDDEDFKELNKVNWYALHDQNNWYAIRFIRRADGSRTAEFMHRRILNVPARTITDHRNGNGLDNRKENLRICTVSQNQQNRHRIFGTSQYQGVNWYKDRRKWIARIMINRKAIHIGYFVSEGLAAIAYNIAALRYFGVDAKLNDV